MLRLPFPCLHAEPAHWKILCTLPRVHMDPECVWWVLSIWNLVIISARAKDLEGGWKRSLEALTNILNQEMLGSVLSWLIYPVAFQKAHGCWKGLMCTPFFFPSSLPARWSQIPNIFVACCDTTSTVSFTEKYWYKKRDDFSCLWNTKRYMCFCIPQTVLQHISFHPLTWMSLHCVSIWELQ